MKRKTIGFLVATSFLTMTFVTYAFMPPEHQLRKEYWDSLDAKTKPVFLMGFQHGSPRELKLPEPDEKNVIFSNKAGFLYFAAHDIPKIVQRVDAFYKVKENKDVCIRLAIQISVMEMQGRPKEEIDTTLQIARDMPGTMY